MWYKRFKLCRFKFMLVCGSVVLLRIYVYMPDYERCNPYSVCVPLGRKLWCSFKYNPIPSISLNGLFYYESIDTF
jgi:hypothetical protein